MADFAFVYGNLRRDGVAQRIQSLPIMQGLNLLGRSTRRVVLNRLEKVEIRAPVLLFHYHDDAAQLVVRRIKADRDAIAICFGSDVYRLDRYVAVSDFVDAFVVPTEMHRAVLCAAVDRQVHYVPEAVDPIALPVDDVVRDIGANGELVWFGYPESYEKSVGLLAAQLFRRRPDVPHRLTAICGGALNSPLVKRTIDFRADHFYADTAAFSHALLSHFPYDLAVNTLIKSPNKLITSLVRGLVPITSATPAYTAIAETYGLQRQLFRTAAECEALLDAMDYQAQARELHLDDVRAAMLSDFSPLRVASRFLAATNL